MILTRLTVWLALSLYVAAELVKARWPQAARWLMTLGCAAFLGHVACAFHFHHGWSHAAAYRDTARQTAELVGWNSGAGLYVNYLFALVWIGEAGWVWTRRARPKWITWTIRGFFWFMIFNGAVVFVHGPMRGLGIVLCAALALRWSISTPIPSARSGCL